MEDTYGIDMSKYPEGWSFENNCTQVGEYCPVEATTLGYYPNLPINAILTGWFTILAIVGLGLGIKGRVWSYSVVITIASILEAVGYGSRIWYRINPYEEMSLMTQLISIILAPTLYCAAIYLTLKHLALGVGEHMSRLKPFLYSWIFVSADVSCLVIQGVGGAFAASAEDEKTAKLGENLMVSGVSIQLAVLTIFAAFLGDFYYRARKEYQNPRMQTEHNPGYLVWSDKKFRMFVKTTSVAFLLIWLRCIYRIVELVSGWGGTVMRDEISFIILESLFIAISATIMTCAHPTLLFPQMGTGHPRKTILEDSISSIKLNPKPEPQN